LCLLYSINLISLLVYLGLCYCRYNLSNCVYYIVSIWSVYLFILVYFIVDIIKVIVFIILYDNKSSHFTCFQLHVLFVVSKQDQDYLNNVFDMKFIPPLEYCSLESILSTKPRFLTYRNESFNSPFLPNDNPLIK